MEGSQMLTGSQLVAKGVTKKVDIKLPELGLKEVSPSGSWLEQKQIQSALEARKHLIEVERIEKIGTLSHAIWRDDLKLAEVTQQTGGYWQYIGHNIGKHIFLRPEEALFLIEINCLLLKHNDVTVPLQKAYSLCLGDISLAQYKVYASLSRLGYRVLRHKKHSLDNKSNIQNATNENNIATDGTAPVNCPLTIKIVSNHTEKLDNYISILDQIGDDPKSGCTANEEIKSCGSISTEVSNNVPDIKIEKSSIMHSDNENDSSVPLIDADNIKVEIDENHAGSEVIENDINSAIEKTLQSSGIDPSDESKGTGDEIPPVDQESRVPAYSENEVPINVNENISIRTADDKNTSENQDANMLTSNGEVEPNICIISTCMKTVDDSAAAIDVDDNANETVVIATGNNENRIDTVNEAMDTESSNIVITGIVYSVDELGVIRVIEEKIPTILEGVESNTANSNTADTNNIDPGPGTNDSMKQYEKNIQHYETKMKKLLKRKAIADHRTDIEGINSIQDFYHQEIVSVNVPEEKYLPRNIFLHKAAYALNVDTVRNQNASNANVSGDEADQIESHPRADRGTDAPRVSDLPRFNPNIFNGPPRYHNPYPPYRANFRSPNWFRQSYNTYYNYNMARQQNYFFHPRNRYQPQPFPRQHLMNYNHNMPNPTVHNQTEMGKRNEMKAYHFNTIVNIATRFKSGFAAPTQVQALKNLLGSYNSHYGEHCEMTPNYDIIQGSVQDAREVIVLDDDVEPKSKKQRLNDSNERMNINLEKLKVLAGKLKDLHAKNLAVSRHRRVFSNAIKTFNKSFNADFYLDTNFEIKDKKLIVLDSSSDSDAVVHVKEKDKTKKKKKLNPFNIMKRVSKNVNDGASTSREVPILQTLSLNMINEGASTSQNLANENNTDIDSPVIDNNEEGLLKYFDKAWLPSEEDFGRAELCSLGTARLDALLFEAEYLYDVLKESAEFQNWLDVKVKILKEIQGSVALQKQQAIALSNDFIMETESYTQPIIGPDCTDLRSALKQLAIIPTNKEIPAETSLKIDFDVCNRNIHFKKTSPPKPNFRVICLDESAPFPSSEDVVALQAKYDDGVPKVIAFVGTGSISYLQVNPTDLPVFIPDTDPT